MLGLIQVLWLLIWKHSGENWTNASSVTRILCGMPFEETFDNYASSQAGHLVTHLKMHRGEKSNKCNQCDYASSLACDLRRHLKTHSGEKSNKCLFASMGFKDTFENAQRNKSQTNATIATTHLRMQTFLGVIWKKCDGQSLNKT